MAESAAPGASWPRIALLLCCGFCVALQFGRTPASLPLLQREFGLSLAAAGWMVSSVSLLSAFGGFFAGMFAVRSGATRAALTGLGLAVLGCAIGLLARDPAQLIAGRVIEGAGFIITVTAVPPLLMRAAGAGLAPTVMAIWGTYLPGGMALMIALALPMLGAGDWRGPMLLNGGLVLATTLVFALVARADLRSSGTGAGTPAPAILKALLRRRTPPLLGAIFVLYAAQFLAVMSFLPLIFLEIGWASGATLAVTAAVVAMNAAGNLAGGVLVRRGVHHADILTFAILAMGVAAMLTLLPLLPATGRMLCGAALSFCGGAIPATLLATVAQLPLTPEERTGSFGLLLQSAGIGQLLGPPLFGIVAGHGGWSAAAVLVAVLSGAAMAIARGLR